MAAKLPAREQMLEYLAEHGGRLEDPQGMAATLLRQRLHLPDSAKHVLGEMETQGLIRREIRGRRTFSIELLAPGVAAARRDGANAAAKPSRPVSHRTERHAPGEPDAAEGRERADGVDGGSIAGVDLAALADTLLAIVVKRASGPGTGSPELAERLRRAEEIQAATEAHMAELVAERDSAQAQVRELEHRLEVMERNLRRATSQRPAPAAPQRGREAVERLDAEGRALLESVFGSIKGS